MSLLSNSDHVLRAAVNARVAVMLVGAPGTTKTASIRQLAKDTNRTLITIVPSRMDPQDLSGFPTKGTYTYDDVVVPVTEFAPQHWQLDIMRLKRVILFLDEFSNAHPSVRASLLSFIQDREFPNGDKFPDETVIVGAMNPTDSAADGYELDPATTNRIMFLSWKPSVDAWINGMPTNWGAGVENKKEREWRNLIVRFINDEPGALHMESDPSLRGDAYGVNTSDSSDMAVLQYAWASRRSWDNLSRLLGALDTKDTIIEDTIMAGTVGYRAANQFRDWLRKNGAIDIAKILKNPRGFDGWEALSMDDTNLILRSAVDSADENSTMEKIMGIMSVFEIIHEIDRTHLAAPFLIDFTKVRNRSKKITAKQKQEITEKLREVAKLYKSVSVTKRAS